MVGKKNPLFELQKLLYHSVTKAGGEWLEFHTPPEKFLPHISIGKVSSEEKLQQVKSQLSKDWQPIRFTVKEIYLLSKLVHDTTVRYVIPLGGFPESRETDFKPVPFPSDSYSININWIPPGATDSDLNEVFAKYYKVLEAKVIFKTIEQKNYVKGWGNVVFANKAERDEALAKKWTLFDKPLELFPCD